MERDFKVIDPTPLIVGECPLWDERKQLLYTIDIRGKCMMYYVFLSYSCKNGAATSCSAVISVNRAIQVHFL